MTGSKAISIKLPNGMSSLSSGSEAFIRELAGEFIYSGKESFGARDRVAVIVTQDECVPASFSAYERARALSGEDVPPYDLACDGLVKAVLDGLERSGCLRTKSQIKYVSYTRQYASEPQVRIAVVPA